VVLVQDGVSESDELAVIFREERRSRRGRPPQPLVPDSPSVGDDVTVEEGVGVRASVVAPPAVRVEGGYPVGVRDAGDRDLHPFHGPRSWRTAGRGATGYPAFRPLGGLTTREKGPNGPRRGGRSAAG